MNQQPPLPAPPGFTELGHAERQVFVLSEVAESLAQLGFVEGKPRQTAVATVQGRREHAIHELSTSQRVLWKRCTRGGLMEPLLHDLHRNARRFLEEVRVTEEARASGVSVARILGVAIERARGGLFVRVETLSELVAEARDGADLLADRSLSAFERREVLRAAAQELRRFHGLGFLHGDLNVKNLLWHIRDGAPGITLIDIDPGSAGTRAGADGITNLLRLARSYRKGQRAGLWNLHRTDWFAFLARYFGGDRPGLREFIRRARRQDRLQGLRPRRRAGGARGEGPKP